MPRYDFDILRDVLAAGVATLTPEDRATLAAGLTDRRTGRTSIAPVHLDRLRSDLPKLLGIPPAGWTPEEYAAATAAEGAT